MSVKQFFESYLVVDTVAVKKGCFSLTPIRKEWNRYAGKYLPSDASWDIDTPCIFLDEEKKGCKLHDAGVKPLGGKNMKCWEARIELEAGSGNDTSYIKNDDFSFTSEELETLVGWDEHDDPPYYDSSFNEDEE